MGQTATQLYELHERIERIANGNDYGVLSGVMSLLEYRKRIARDYMDKCKRFGRSEVTVAYGELFDSINEKINTILLTNKI